MTRTLLSTLIAGLVLAALGASATRADVHSAVVDFGNCNFNGSTATVAAGLPIDLTNTGGFATGTYGTTLHAALTSVERATITVTGGATTTVPLPFSKPYFDSNVGGWVTTTPDIQLAPLAPGGSVDIVIDQTNLVAQEYVFPGQHFGPFHNANGETFEAGCLISGA